MKRVVSFVLTVLLLISAVSMISLPASAATAGNLVYYVSGNKATITGYTGTPAEVVIPETLGGYPVNTIDYKAFSNCDSLTSITIPDSVTSIGDYAFYSCDALTSVTIGDSVTSIGYESFTGCTSLNEVYITNLAAWCSISCDIDEDVEYGNSNPLNNGADLYLNGEKVIDLVIPEGVTFINDEAFANCTSLESVTIPDSVTSIGFCTFYGCPSLKSVTIPGSITVIEKIVFAECNALTDVNISRGVINIEEGAFYSCRSLTNITIPDSVTSIDGGYYGGAFEGCTSLTNVSIPNSIKFIEESAFSGCTSLTNISIPGSVKSIGESSFSGCTSLESVTIAYGIEKIEYEAFRGCTSLKSIILPNSITTVNVSAFSDCSGVCAIVLPKPAVLPAKFMNGFTNLQCVYFQGSAQQWEEAGYYLPEDVTVHIGANSKKLKVSEYACGSRTVHCELCKKTLFSAGQHTPGKWKTVKKATATKNGLAELRCTGCAVLLDSKVIKKTGANALKVFSDLKKSDWYVKNGAIDFAYSQGLFSGTSANTFGPKDNMTRGMFVTVLGRLHGVKSTKATTKFTDVKKNAYYSGYVAWASKNGIVSGTSATTFGPEDNINREQICAMMVRYCNFAGIKLKKLNKAVTFNDAKSISSFAKKAVSACQVGGIVGGEKYGKGYRFRPKGNATRAEVATIMMQFYKMYVS